MWQVVLGTTCDLQECWQYMCCIFALFFLKLNEGKNKTKHKTLKYEVYTSKKDQWQCSFPQNCLLMYFNHAWEIVDKCSHLDLGLSAAIPASKHTRVSSDGNICEMNTSVCEPGLRPPVLYAKYAEQFWTFSLAVTINPFPPPPTNTHPINFP